MTPQGTSPLFVGRDAELGLLRDHARAARSEGSAMLLLGGDAGVGKSRLLAEFTTRAGGTRTLAGGCLELGVEGLPFAPFVAVLRQLLHESGHAAFDALASDGEQELARLLPELGRTPVERREARGRLFEQVLRLLQETAEPDGLTIVIEDLHWADSATRDLLVFLVRNLDRPGVQLLVSYRADDLHRGHQLRRLLPELQRLPSVTHLDLAPLNRADTARQAAAIRGTELDGDEADALYERSAGNPLFVESLAAHADLMGSWVPDRPRELLLSTLDRLGDAERLLLRMAAVGAVSSDHIDHTLLAEVAALSEAGLDTALTAIVDANVLRVHGNGYRFRHSLLREAVHQDLLPGQHARLHLRFAEAMDARPELVPADRIAAEQAHHFHAAHELPRALSAAWWAAVRAKEALAYAEELRMLERVIELWDRVPDAAERVEGRSLARVLKRTAGAAFDSGADERAKDLCDAALTELAEHPVVPEGDDPGTAPQPTTGTSRARAHGTQVQRALLLRLRGRVRIQLADNDGIDDLWAALDVHPPDDWGYGFHLAIIARELMMRGGRVPVGRLPPHVFSHELVGRTDDGTLTSTDLVRAALGRAAAAGDHCAEADALITLGSLDGNVDRFDEAMANFAKGIAIAKEAHEPALELRGICNQSSCMHEAGRLADALALTDAALRRAGETSLQHTMGAFVSLNRAEIYYELGELAHAHENVLQGLHWARSPVVRSFLRIVQGRIALAHGDLVTAKSVTDRIRRHGTLGFSHLQHSHSAATLAIDVHIANGEPAKATAVARTVDASVDVDVDVDLSVSYYWPLLVTMSRALVAHRAADGPEAATELHQAIRKLVTRMPAYGSVQRARRSTVHALLAEVEGAAPVAVRAAWKTAVSGWDGSEYPLCIAEARLAAAAAASAAGDRAAAGPWLREAARAAKESGAEPLALRVADLARRTGLPLDTETESAPPVAPAGLTPRETEVLRLLALGRTNAEIAVELFISAKTASVHVSNILGKLALPNRGAAAARARELGMA